MSRSAKGFCHGLCGAVRTALHSVVKLLAVDLVTVAQEIGGRGVVREGVYDLLGGPVGGGVLGHVEVDDAPAVVSEHDENKEDAQARGWHRDVGPVQGRNPLGLRFLRRFRPAGTVEGDRLANERLEGGLVNFFSFVDVDRAAYVSVETRVEETGRILQRRALGEGQLHDFLVGFASADDAVVRPNRSAHPFPLLDDVRVCLLDELAHSAEGFPAPLPEFGDSFRDELRCRLALARARLFHVLILAGISILNSRATDNLYLTVSVFNPPAKFSTA